MTNRKQWALALSVGFEFLTKENLEKCFQAGITQLELSSAEFQPYYDAGFLTESPKIAENAKETGVNITSVHLPFYPFGIIDPTGGEAAHRNTALKKQGELISAAGKAGISIAVIHPSSEPYSENERSWRLDNAVDFLEKLTYIAQESGVTLAVENLPRTCIGRNSDEMNYILERIPSLRVCFDTNHSLLQDNKEFIKALGNKIITLHVSDYDFADEKHWLPLEGKNDWEGIIAQLERSDYQGRFLYELRQGYSLEEISSNYKKLIY